MPEAFEASKIRGASCLWPLLAVLRGGGCSPSQHLLTAAGIWLCLGWGRILGGTGGLTPHHDPGCTPAQPGFCTESPLVGAPPQLSSGGNTAAPHHLHGELLLGRMQATLFGFGFRNEFLSENIPGEMKADMTLIELLRVLIGLGAQRC